MNWKKTLIIGLLIPSANTVAFIWFSVIALTNRSLSEMFAVPDLIRITVILCPILCVMGLATAVRALRKSLRNPTAWSAALATFATLVLLVYYHHSFLLDILP